MFNIFLFTKANKNAKILKDIATGLKATRKAIKEFFGG